MTEHKKAPPGGGTTGRGLMSVLRDARQPDVTRRTSSCAERFQSEVATGLREENASKLVDEFHDAPRARLDQHGLAVDDGVAVSGGAETLRHVIIGDAGLR